jgi:hypothetical protein
MSQKVIVSTIVSSLALFHSFIPLGKEVFTAYFREYAPFNELEEAAKRAAEYNSEVVHVYRGGKMYGFSILVPKESINTVVNNLLVNRFVDKVEGNPKPKGEL